MTIQCPPNAVAGQQIVVDVGGQQMQVAVPAGVVPGQTFQIQVPAQQQPEVVVMAQPVGAQQAGYGAGYTGYDAGYGGGYGDRGGYGGRNAVHVSIGGGRKRLSQEGWCWVIVLFLLFWPICWLPFVMEGCYEYY